MMPLFALVGIVITGDSDVASDFICAEFLQDIIKLLRITEL
jgi:hypothetical protein